MLNFLDLCSLDIHYDLESNALLCGDSIKYNQFQKVRLKNLAPVLLNKSLSYPEDVYEEYIGVFQDGDQALSSKGLSYDIINLPAGLLGIEFVKTHVFYSPENTEPDQVSSSVEVMHGTLTILLQRNALMDPCEFGCRVEKAYLVNLKRGERYSVPEGYYYTFINTSEEPVIFSRAYRSYRVADYAKLRKERGLAYYCIRKNGRQEIVLNPLYRNSPVLEEVGCNCQLVKDQFNSKCSLYQQIKGQINVLMTEINS